MERFKPDAGPNEEPLVVLDDSPKPNPKAKIVPANDGIEYEIKRGPAKTREELNLGAEERPTLSLEQLRERINYLDKVRQGNVEYEEAYRNFTSERPDLAKMFSVGKNGEAYQSTRDAAHDLVEYLAKETEQDIRAEEVVEKNAAKERERQERNAERMRQIAEQKRILDLLNKARQGNVEHEDVYWHVFGKGSTSSADYPGDWVNRPDLLKDFAVGKNGEPYTNTRDASHDLIERLAKEVEGKIKEMSGKDKEDGGEGPVDGGGDGGGGGGGGGQEEPPQPPEGPDTTRTPEIFNPQELVDARSEYFKAKRLRGNVIRGKAGGFLKRLMSFGEEEMDFGGEEGKKELEGFRDRYQVQLDRHRIRELSMEEAALRARMEGGQEQPKMLRVFLARRALDLIREEQRNVDEISTEGIERNRLEKLKTKWRQMGRFRLVTGALLGGAGVASAMTGVAVPLVMGGRAVWGSVGTYTGTEAGLERYSKLIGHKGLVSAIAKQIGRSVNPDAVDRAVSNINPEDIRKEASRLRMLQVERGVAMRDLLSAGDSTGAIAEAIIRMDDILQARQVAEGIDASGPGVAVLIADKLNRETNSRNEVIESEVDRERINKMLRKIIAAAAGGATGWLIGNKLFHRVQPSRSGDINIPNTPKPPLDSTRLPETGVLPNVHSLHRVVAGENTWKIIERNLDSNSVLNGLDEGARTHVIDSFKDIFDKMSATELKDLGFTSGDANILHIGDAIDIAGKVEDPSLISQALLNARGLSPDQVASIVKNNKVIFDWLSAHGQELVQSGKVMNSSIVERVLRGTI